MKRTNQFQSRYYSDSSDVPAIAYSLSPREKLWFVDDHILVVVDFVAFAANVEDTPLQDSTISVRGWSPDCWVA